MFGICSDLTPFTQGQGPDFAVLISRLTFYSYTLRKTKFTSWWTLPSIIPADPLGIMKAQENGSPWLHGVLKYYKVRALPGSLYFEKSMENIYKWLAGYTAQVWHIQVTD